MIAFKCPECGKQNMAPDEWAGRRAKCSGCKSLSHKGNFGGPNVVERV